MCFTNSTNTNIYKKLLILAIPISHSDYWYTSNVYGCLGNKLANLVKTCPSPFFAKYFLK